MIREDKKMPDLSAGLILNVQIRDSSISIASYLAMAQRCSLRQRWGMSPRSNGVDYSHLMFRQNGLFAEAS